MNSQLAAERGIWRTLALLLAGPLAPAALFGAVALAYASCVEIFRRQK